MTTRLVAIDLDDMATLRKVLSHYLAGTCDEDWLNLHHALATLLPESLATPKPDEPDAHGSVIESAARVLIATHRRTNDDGLGSWWWVSVNGIPHCWGEFSDDVKILRVGIGGDPR